MDVDVGADDRPQKRQRYDIIATARQAVSARVSATNKHLREPKIADALALLRQQELSDWPARDTYFADLKAKILSALGCDTNLEDELSAATAKAQQDANTIAKLKGRIKKLATEISEFKKKNRCETAVADDMIAYFGGQFGTQLLYDNLCDSLCVFMTSHRIGFLLLFIGLSSNFNKIMK
jgi:hypothetical protein